MKKQSQPLRLEVPHHAQLITCRTINGALWFVNNNALLIRIYAFLAKYQEKYGVLIYGFEVVGNHYHLLASFPNSNRADFERDPQKSPHSISQNPLPQLPDFSRLVEIFTIIVYSKCG